MWWASPQQRGGSLKHLPKPPIKKEPKHTQDPRYFTSFFYDFIGIPTCKPWVQLPLPTLWAAIEMKEALPTHPAYALNWKSNRAPDFSLPLSIWCLSLKSKTQVMSDYFDSHSDLLISSLSAMLDLQKPYDGCQYQGDYIGNNYGRWIQYKAVDNP